MVVFTGAEQADWLTRGRLWNKKTNKNAEIIILVIPGLETKVKVTSCNSMDFMDIKSIYLSGKLICSSQH